jgi:hypothetical protein
MAAKWTFRRDGDFVIATEKWQLDDPELPFIVSPWHPQKASIERRLQTAKWLATDYPFREPEFVETFGADKLPPHLSRSSNS